MLLTAPLAVSAQETLTIYPNATGTNKMVPIYGDNGNFYAKCEYIIPSSQLAGMEDGIISQMTFYLSTPASNGWGNANFQVFLMEVDATSISSYYGPLNATIVYEGPLSGTQSTMNVAFNTNYTYEGGNLLVGFYNTVIGNSSDAYFQGQTVNGACVRGNNRNSLSYIQANQANFVPKTTFTYTPGNSSCLTPKSLTATNITNTSASLSWTPRGEENSWDVQYRVSGSDTWIDKGTVTSARLRLGQSRRLY